MNSKDELNFFSITSLLCAILVIPWVFLSGITKSHDGWGGIGYAILFVSGLTLLCILGVLFGVVARVRKEKAKPIGLIICTPGMMIGLYFIGPVWISGYQYSQELTTSIKRLPPEVANQIADESGCPKKSGTGNPGIMQGLWEMRTGSRYLDPATSTYVYEVAQVRPNGDTTYYEPKDAKSTCHHPIANVNISVTGEQYLYTSTVDSGCKYYVQKMAIENTGESEVTITMGPPPSRVMQWVRLKGDIDFQECKR